MVGYNWVRDQYAFIVIDKDVKPGNYVGATTEYKKYVA